MTIAVLVYTHSKSDALGTVSWAEPLQCSIFVGRKTMLHAVDLNASLTLNPSYTRFVEINPNIRHVCNLKYFNYICGR